MANRKRKNVDSVVTREVAAFLLDNPGYTGKDLKKNIERSLKRKGLNYNFTERTYQNIKAKIWPNIGDSTLDKPWDMGSLNHNPIPSESIPILLSLQNSKRSEGQPMMTVREAKWLSRLYSLGQFVGTGSDRLQSANVMATRAQAYALREKVCEVAGVDCDTSDLDQGLLGDFNIALDKWEWRFLFDIITKTGPDHLIKDEKTLRTTLYTLETMALEMEFLRYSLGRPDLDLDSWDVYVQILQCLPDAVRSDLRTLGREQAERFFISLRQWVKNHPRIGDEVSNDVKESMEKDCSQVALKIVSLAKKSKGKRGRVKESMSVVSLAALIAEGIDKERRKDGK